MTDKALPHNVHDNRYMLTVTCPELAADLLTGYANKNRVDQLDFSTLENTKDSYVNDDHSKMPDSHFLLFDL